MTQFKAVNNPMPRICLLTESFYPIVGGGETHARLLSEKLIEYGVDLFVITRRVFSDSKRYEMIGEVPVYRVRPSGFKRIGKYLMMGPALWKLIRKRNEYDVLFVCGIRTLGFIGVLILLFYKKNCILRQESCGEMSGDFMRQGVAREKRLLLKFIDTVVILRNHVLRKADGFISISEAIKKELLLCNIEHRKIKYIPNGIDTNRFLPVDGNIKYYLREKLNLPQKKLIFSYSGKLNREKGLELLLKIWKRIIEEREDNVLHLALIGSGRNQFLSCEDELKQFVKNNKLEESVTFTGYVENVYEYLQCSDFFILPSESEALPLSLLEALSCELPSIATKVGGIPDIIHDGENGRLVDVRDEEGLYNSIVEMLKNGEFSNRIGKKGRKTVIERFSINSVANQYIMLFSSLFNAEERKNVSS